MSCPVKQTITSYLQKEGKIDVNQNFKVGTEEIQGILQSLNEFSNSTYNVPGELVTTRIVKNAAGVFTKITFNDNIAYKIDSIRNGESEAKNAFGKTEPLGDNFVEIVNYKKKQVEDLTKEINKLNSAQSLGVNNKDLRRKAAIYNSFKKELEDHISVLEDGTIDNLFHAVHTDIDRLMSDLNNPNQFNLKQIKERRDFLWEFVKGTSFDSQMPSERFEGLPEHEDFNNLRGKLDALKDKYNTSSQKFVEASMQENISYNALVENIKGSGKTPQEVNKMLENLFTATNDINFFDKWALGISNSMNWDTLYPQLMHNTLEYEQHKERTTVNRIKNKLKAIVGDEKDLDFVKERDADGNLTGYIQDSYSASWAKVMVDIKKSASNYRFKKKGATKEAAYRLYMNKVRDSADFVDPRKLKAISETYSQDPAISQYFKFSEAEMDFYEAELINKIGQDKYNKILQTLTNQIEDHLEEVSNGKRSFAYLASMNVLNFMESISDPTNTNSLIYYTETSGNTYSTRFSDLESLVFIPKTRVESAYDPATGSTMEVDSKFYNEAYKNLDVKQKEILAGYREAAEYFNNTYSLNKFDKLAYPKVMQEFNEQAATNFANKKYSQIARDLAHEYKKYFYETGRFSVPGTKVKQNYRDSSKQQIAEKTRINVIKGMDEELAYVKARNEILSMYSQDTLTDMNALLDLASEQRARENSEPVINSYFEAFKNVKAVRNGQTKERKRAYEKTENWINAKIYGESEKERDSGSIGGETWLTGKNATKAFEILGGVKVLGSVVNEKSPKLLNEVEKDLYNELMSLKQTGIDGSLKSMDFTVGDVKYTMVMTKNQNGVTKPMYRANDVGGSTTITKEEFESQFNGWIDSKIADLGLDLTTSGVIQGIMKTTILKGLGFNFISGIFNRMEGKNSLLIMDNTGNFWTQGNADKANAHMNLFNMFKMAPSLVTNMWKDKHAKVQNIKNFIEILDLMQDKKNVFEANSESSRFDFGIGIFKWSVDNPEIKNQGTIALAIAMDHKVVNNLGVETSLYDEDGNFTTFDNVDGQLVLKPEFMDPANGINDIYDFLGTDTIFQLKQKIKQAISKSQGNYDPNDTMYMTKNAWGKALSTFTKWRYEHIMQRFSPGKGTDLTFGKDRARGRYMHLWDSAGAMGAAAGVVGGVTFGFGLPIVGAMAGVGLTAVVIKKFFKNTYFGEIEKESSYINEYAAFLASVVMESLNYPLMLVNVNGKYRLQKILGYDPKAALKQNSQMTEEQASNIVASARELGMMLVWLGILMGFKALTWDDDDDKESDRRMLHNFGDNQINRIVGSMLAYSNPKTMFSDMSRFAVLEQLFKVMDVTAALAGDPKSAKNIGKILLEVSPMPRILYRNRLPWHDKAEYDNIPGMLNNTYSTWTDEIIKDRGDKREFERYKAKKIKEITEDLNAQGLEGDAFDEAFEKRKAAEVITKARNLDYNEVMDEVNSGDSFKSIKAKRKANKVKEPDEEVEE